MPIVPAANILKSIKTGAPYSPAVSFNPDKRAIFDMDVTTFGVLTNTAISTDGVNITIPTGFTFIQNGIIVKLTAPFIILIPVIAFPKFIVADNVDETPGSNVTISILGVITPPQVLLGTITPNNTTIVQARQVSIRGLLEAISALTIKVEQDAVTVVDPTSVINAIGPNLTAVLGGPGQANVSVKLDVKESGTPKTAKTEEIDFLGPTVTPTTGSKASVDSRLQSKDEGVVAVSNTRKINYRGGGVSAAVDGGDPTQVNVDIPAGGGVTGDGIVDGLIDGDGGTRQLNLTAAIISINGVLSAPFTGTVTVATNVSGNNRWDLLQYNGAFSMKLGTPACPAPDVGYVPVAVVLVPDSPSSLVRSMNKQSTLSDPVIVAYYNANGGLHASRVGVTVDPSTTSLVFVDALEMDLSLYFPRVGYRYELHWDTMIKQTLYGFFSEGAFINMSFDGTDEDDDVQTRGYLHSDFAVSLDGFEIGVVMHYNRLVTVGSHELRGRWKIGQVSTPEKLSQKRRRIWVTEMF